MIKPVTIWDGLTVEMDVLTHRLTKSVQASCSHPNEHISHFETSDSDTLLETHYCPDCKKVWGDERIGSFVRAESEMQREDLP